MSNHNVIFPLNDTEKIAIELEHPITELDCCTQAPIVFIHDSQKAILGIDSVQNNLIIFKNLLEKALSNKLQLHASITEDIGYLFNQYSDFLCNDTSQVQDTFSYTKLEGNDIWVGDAYNLWNSKDVTSWIYNDADGAIIFELTPLYSEDFHYQKWIKGYKPYLIATIPHDIAQQWLDQADAILKQIDKNIKKLIKEAEGKE